MCWKVWNLLLLLFYILIGSLQISPEIYVSVIAQGFLMNGLRVILQGICLSKSNVHEVLNFLNSELKNLENELAEAQATDG